MIDDFNGLILRCQARRRKKVIRITINIIALLILVVAFIVAYIQFYTQQQIHLPTKPVNLTPTVKDDTNVTLATLPVPSIVISDLNTSAIQSIPKPPAVISHPVSASVTPQPPEPAAVAAQPILPKTKQNSLFEVTSSSKALSSMTPQERFDASPKYETALSNARDLYTKNNFVDAAIWAKKANQMNREAEEAWLLYAKSYYAQGRKNEAIDVLMLYLNYKDSKIAQELLRTWKSTQ